MHLLENHFLLIDLFILISHFIFINGSYVPDNNKEITHQTIRNIDNNSNAIKSKTYSSEILNCFYNDTIDISDIYMNQTIIPPNLVGDYDYEILYDGSKRLVQQHKRACICHVRTCITFCTSTIKKYYESYVKNNKNYKDTKGFSIGMTLRNKTVLKKNIVEDFYPIIKEIFCETSNNIVKELNPKADWTLYENGTLLVHNHRHLQRSEYCFDFHKTAFGEDNYNLIIPRICREKDTRDSLKKLYYWTQVISFIFLLLTLAVYCYVPELQNLHGKIFMTFAGSLALFLAIFSFINLTKINISSEPCLLIAYFKYYLYLFHYTWMAILCYDIWRNLNNSEYKSSYLKYASCGYTLPLLVVLLVFAFQSSNIYEVITNDRCHLYAHKWWDILYIYGPCLIIITFCLTLIVLTLRLLKIIYNEIYVKLSLKESPESCYNPFLRLFFMMVFSWFLEILIAVFYIANFTIATVIIDCLNALQGLCIFIIFIGRRKIFNMIKRTYYDN